MAQNQSWEVLTAPGPCERHCGLLEHKNSGLCGLASVRIDPNGDEQRPSKQQRRSLLGGGRGAAEGPKLEVGCADGAWAL